MVKCRGGEGGGRGGEREEGGVDRAVGGGGRGRVARGGRLRRAVKTVAHFAVVAAAVTAIAWEFCERIVSRGRGEGEATGVGGAGGGGETYRERPPWVAN